MAAAWFAHTPAKQSAWSSVRTDAALGTGLAAARLLERAEEVLDVVAVFVGDDVALRQRPAAGAEARAQLLEEVEVEVDELVERAVERAAGRASRCRSRSVVAPENRTVSTGWYVSPDAANSSVQYFWIAVDVAEDPAVVALVGVLAGLAVGGERGALRAGHRAGFEERAEIVRVAAEQRVGEQQDEADRAAATDGEAAAAAHAAAVGDLAGIELGTWVEGHGESLALGLRLAILRRGRIAAPAPVAGECSGVAIGAAEPAMTSVHAGS